MSTNEPLIGTDWAFVDAMSDEDIILDARTDLDNPELTAADIVRLRRAPVPREIREQLGLSQREFARQFQIALGTLRDWEQGATRLDRTAQSYLRAIQHAPEVVRAALGTAAGDGADQTSNHHCAASSAD
ncbi:MAG: helix-turn-helix domain-containing protein [Thermomicrobiales bacterium]